ncbi:putative hexose transport-related protein [Karstenula rhodostoma CBS 690.94]|uniref:Hexose transport-related protein n=1 Tax=Karstenula rhodostoma CBS 690.94 TaxID=1392251 RepID=A0A9P4UD23_9PLEO|nr:putative hexose transport-related protein [Karstenula rhodostoma CBS 690.94]
MGFGVVEDRPTPPEVYNWRIYTLAIVASFGAEHFGFNDMSASAGTSTMSNITSTHLVAGFFGSLFAWPSSEALDRIRAMQLTCAVFMVGAVLMTATTSSLPMMYAGRVLTGFGVDALTGIIPSYIAEVAPTAIRGQLTGHFDVGSLVGFWINYGITKNMGVHSAIPFCIPLAIQIIPGGVLLLRTLILRGSPTLLWRKEVGRLEEEQRLSGGQTGCVALLRGSTAEMKTSSIRYRLAVTVGMFVFHNWSGSICMNYYSLTLFKSLLISDVALYTGIYGVCRSTAATAFYSFIVDRTGRRIPWLISTSTCSLTLFAVAMVMLYGIFWSLGGNGLPWIVAAEIFPARLRPITGAFAASLQWLFSFILTLAPPLCFLTAVFTFVWVPETKAVPIECCEALFSGKMRHAAWRAKKLFPPNGIPPLLNHIAEGEAAYIQAHRPSSPSDIKTKNYREEIESV